MALPTRIYDFQNGDVADANQVDDELNRFTGIFAGTANFDVKFIGKTYNLHKQLVADSTIVGTGANTTETDLATYTIPSQTLIATNDWIEMFVSFEIAADANNKTIRGYFNGNLILTAGPTSGATYTHAQFWMKAIRLSATSVRVVYNYGQAAFGIFWEVTTPVTAGNLDSTTNIFKMTGQNAVATANQIQKFYHEIKYCNNA